MTLMKKCGPDCFDLNQITSSLAERPTVQALLRDSIEEDQYEAALQLMRDGIFEKDLGWAVHDLLSDAIHNDARIVWSGLIPGIEDDYPVRVNEYHGVFWVWAMEYDPIGYFASKETAINYVLSNWDDVYVDDDNTGMSLEE